ncbi:hypothetical protein Droror1_Dr00007954 [Drosera rotundifolia]
MGGGWSQDEEPKAPVQTEVAQKTKAREETKLPHYYEAIIKDSDSPVDRSSVGSLYDQLHGGVFLNGKRKKYWVDKQGKNCFMVFAKDLFITWADDNRYWHWRDMDTSDGINTVAELRSVCWLEVHGRFDTTYLSPDATYEVAFVVMMLDCSSGWEVNINVRLKTLANGSESQHKENLREKPRNKWIEISAGQIKGNNVGEVEISLFEYEGGLWKRGLIIKGIIIQPKMS